MANGKRTASAEPNAPLAATGDAFAAPSVSPSSGLPIDPDTRRMLRVRENDTAAFEEIVSAYQHRVIAMLYHMTGNLEEAEDLAQEVFLRVFRARESYQPSAKFSTWLFTIVHRLAFNATRNRRRRPKLETAEGGQQADGPRNRSLDQIATAPSGLLPSRLFAKGELAEFIRAAVAQLPEDQRVAVILNKFEEMSYDQIAAIMGRTPMAVKSLLSRARAALRDLLEPYLDRGQRGEL